MADLTKSPIDSMLNFFSTVTVPQGHEKAFKGALFNALGLLLLLLAGVSCWLLYNIFAPFIQPLLWALLCGAALHPIKYSLTQTFQKWVENLEESQTPLCVNFFLIPFMLADQISENIGNQIKYRLKIIIGCSLAFATIFLLYNYTPSLLITCIWRITKLFEISIKLFITYFNGTAILASISGYMIILYFYWTPSLSKKFAYASLAMWILISCYVAHLFGSYQILIFCFNILVLTIGFACETWIIYATKIEKGEEVHFGELLLDILTNFQAPQIQEQIENKKEELLKSSQFKELVEVHKNADLSPTETENKNPTEFKRPQMLNVKSEIEEINPESNKYIYYVLYACGFILLLKNIWIIQIMTLPIIYYVHKHIGNYFGIWEFISKKVGNLLTLMKNWCSTRQDAIFPIPILGIFKILTILKSLFVETLKCSIETATTSVVIASLILFCLLTSIFLATQIYAEGIAMIQVGTHIFNNTILNNSELRSYFPEDWQERVDSVLDDAYIYSRDYISQLVRGWLKDVEEAKAAQLEKQVLELFDRVYQAWMMANSSENFVGPVVSNSATAQSWSDFIAGLQKTPEALNLELMKNAVTANLGTIMSVMESIWNLIQGNLALVFQGIATLFTLIFGGGTALLNWIFDMIVFLTALFYLMCCSGPVYKPVDVITNFSPDFGKRFARALETAIAGVFMASFKLSVFYGLWTWFVLELFQVKIVYIPSVICALLGAIPCLGSYWACLPAVLDLWLAQGNPLLATLLVVLHYIPTMIINSLIYQEIQGGHPYLTGLSIAGGIFCLGAQGAIIGPIMLCALFVAANMFSSALNMAEKSEGIPGNRFERFQIKRLRQMALQLDRTLENEIVENN